MRTKNLHSPFGANVTVPENTWFTIDFIADGNRLIVKVDGVQTVNHTEGAPTFVSGHIALSQAGKSSIEFRKVEVKVLTK